VSVQKNHFKKKNEKLLNLTKTTYVYKNINTKEQKIIYSYITNLKLKALIYQKLENTFSKLSPNILKKV
jgi:predicted transposase YdaD